MRQIQTALLPFQAEHRYVEVPEGISIAEMCKIVYPNKIQGLNLVVLIGNEQVPKKLWGSIKPKKNSLVTINIIPTGGRGGKSALTFVIGIAAAFAAPYLTGALATAFAGGIGPYTAGQLALAKAVTQIGLGIVTSVASSMLASTPSQSRGGSTNIAESPTLFIEGASNRINPYGVIPVNLGVNRMFPPQAALPFTETVGSSQYVRQLFCYGFGNLLLKDEKIGETSLYNYTGVETEYRLNGDLNQRTTIYSNDVFQEGLSVVLEQADVGGATIRTTQADSTEAEIDITFPQGLVLYDTTGAKLVNKVEFEIVFTLTGTSNWSTGDQGKSFSVQTLNYETTYRSNFNNLTFNSEGLIVLNLSTGLASLLFQVESTVPEGHVRIGSFNGAVVVDERTSIATQYFQNPANDFLITNPSLGVIEIAAGTIKTDLFTIQDATSQALRVSKRLVFPEQGQYDIRIRRITENDAQESSKSVSVLSAIRSYNPGNPVLQEGVSGQAVRILATDQLNGSLDRFNGIVSSFISFYDSVNDEWVTGISSNPAAIFRYVLQSPAFVKRLTDDRINIVKLEEWSVYCESKNLTFNTIVDYDTSVDDLLNDICAAGMATLHKVEGIYSVIIDNERPLIKGLVTPRNSWGYSGNMVYPEIPHALLVQFRNRERGYLTDQITVYSDGYNLSNATLFETLEFKSCTDPELAYYYGRRYIATALLQREIHVFNQDFENLTYSRGDRIQIVNDAILVGVGQGRIKTLIYDDEDTPTEVLGFTIDENVTIPNTNQFGVRIRHSDASVFEYYPLSTTIGETNTFTFSTSVTFNNDPEKWLGSLCSFTEFDKELDVIVTDIRRNKDHSARITTVNYAPERFDVDDDPIPPFQSNITLPLDLIRPLPPRLNGEIVSDETVMSRNADGSYTSRMVINLNNDNDNNVRPLVQIKPSGATQWVRPDTLSESNETIVLTGLDNGQTYDLQIRYQRNSTSGFVSAPLALNGVVFQGSTNPPPDVENFDITVRSDSVFLSWDRVDVIDLDRYELRFSSLTTGATWEQSIPINTNISSDATSYTVFSKIGTYLIKAVDISGNYSVNSSLAVTTIGELSGMNIVTLIEEHVDWGGTFSGTRIEDDKLKLGSESQIDDWTFVDDIDFWDLGEGGLNNTGIYYFENTEDLGEVFTSILSAEILVEGENISDVIDNWGFVDGRDNWDSLVASQYNVVLQVRTTDDDPTGSPVWSEWKPFFIGEYTARAFQFRVILSATAPDITPAISSLKIVIDMPDRTEQEGDLNVISTGSTITYPGGAFRNIPQPVVSIDNMQEGDYHQFTSKTSSGFTIRFYASGAVPAARKFSYAAKGYGKVI